MMWILCKSGADVVCLQEVFSNSQREVISEKAQSIGWSVFFPHNQCLLSYLTPWFASGSGLCILVRPGIKVLRQLPFRAFDVSDFFVEILVQKGFFGVTIMHEGKPLNILNTHLQSDFTKVKEYWCVSYVKIRRQQEKIMYDFMKRLPGESVAAGDFNQEHFAYFEKLYDNYEITFWDTKEQLDHVVGLPSNNLSVKKVHVYQDVPYSDHQPIIVDL
jgi:endonuclease/exonuclease/phosphatase family metal-dependent hydrolase